LNDGSKTTRSYGPEEPCKAATRQLGNSLMPERETMTERVLVDEALSLSGKVLKINSPVCGAAA
jgi:hypothetical protein